MEKNATMLSTNLHHYSAAFNHVPSPNMIENQHHHLAAQHMAPSPLDTLTRSSEYAAIQFHQSRHVLPNGKALVKPHRFPYASGPIAPRHQRDMLHERSGRGSATTGPVRRRISRACDQCNQLRTKYVPAVMCSTATDLVRSGATVARVVHIV